MSEYFKGEEKKIHHNRKLLGKKKKHEEPVQPLKVTQKLKSLFEFIMKSMEPLVKIHVIINNTDHEENKMFKS